MAILTRIILIIVTSQFKILRKDSCSHPHVIASKERFLTRLVIPNSTFTAAFSKVGYIGIKKAINKMNVNYS